MLTSKEGYLSCEEREIQSVETKEFERKQKRNWERTERHKNQPRYKKLKSRMKKKEIGLRLLGR